MSEVHAALEKLAHGHDCHVNLLCGERAAVCPPFNQDEPATGSAFVFSCCTRRVSVALTLARGPTRSVAGED
ncbi:hypothetical protein GCM10009844_25220 [Nocardioides koreensis]|uniref:Uncharacterized protein n=1 Tax=Nocardioides koreensis TaxID=433651 RepID=A0ABP5LIC5_9ACTN